MLMRFRRYRVFLIFAALFIFLVVRISKRKDWPQYPQSSVFDVVSPDRKEQPAKAGQVDTAPRRPEWVASTKNYDEPVAEVTKPVKLVVEPSSSTPLNPKTTAPKAEEAIPKTTAAPAVPKVNLPERQRPMPGADSYKQDDLEVDDIHPVAPPGRQELYDIPPASSTIHWEKQVEHFPVPTESIIKLPTGNPVAIPKIQHVFGAESADAKSVRVERQTKVKEEFKKAWGGYKKYAWMHDELSPVSGKFRDPFCGWAATLVDALDTLWIMGLEEEFEDAVKAVELIDFTTSPRSDIPMFETTIRYLGGLVAAYDISGQKYGSLLNKAVELAEVLMGAFDTPNRMPMLYYRWKPAFASQPHRASQRSNLAELGSMSLEFTRLAQLTHDTRYYDAIARITNALEEWQQRGTPLGHVFPENVDASGCNRTMDLLAAQPIAPELIIPSPEEEKVLGYVPDSPETVKEPKKKGVKNSPSGPGTLQVQMIPEDEVTAKAQISDYEDMNRWKKEAGMTKRDTAPDTVPPRNPVSGLPTRTRPNNAESRAEEKDRLSAESATWDCTDQGLEPADSVSGSVKFGMGGGQDSTYEYFPKQFLLLGGQVTQYRELYLKTVNDIKKWMLYRPMIPQDDRAILFAGSVTTQGNPKEDSELIPETTHLTCFIGGMIGMAAKIFGLDGDLEIAEMLSDGCVWAYESTSHGIMPEGALLVPCKSAEHCPWNETLYYQQLDPMWANRDQNVADWIEKKKLVDAELEQKRKAAELKESAMMTNLQQSEDEEDFAAQISHPNANATAELKREKPASLQKRQIESSPRLEVPKPVTHNFKESVAQEKAKSTDPTQDFYTQKTNLVESGLETLENTGWADEHASAMAKTVAPAMRDPSMPFTHKEFVQQRIRQEWLPTGYTSIRQRKYILRPEAIESVWYMYRITGSTTWQDKGWNMFESIISATSTPYGHSAIFDVTVRRNETFQVDEMESFWLAETLKYFYLLYSTPDVVSLDDWVLNTEAHPFRRPDAGPMTR